MCSSRLCLICIGLFLLSLLPVSVECNHGNEKEPTNDLYDELKSNQTASNDGDVNLEKQINLQNTNISKYDKRIEKRNYFISKLFERYGNSKGFLTHEGLHNILKHLGFKQDEHGEMNFKHLEDADHSHELLHDEDKHTDDEHAQYDDIDKRSLESVKLENASLDKEKLHLDNLLQQYEYSLNSSVTREQFINVCPGFVFMLLGLVHMDHDHHEIHEHANTEHEYPPAKVWGFSFLSVIIISLVGLLGVAVIPIMQKVFYNHLLQFLVALAVGALSGDALLHLIPHAFQDGHSNHTDEESHDTSNHVTSVMKGLCGLVGIYFFFLIERLLTIHTQQKRKKNKGKSKYQDNRVVYNEEQTTNFVGQTSTTRNHEPDCEDMVMGIHPGHKALKNYAEESHNTDCHKLDNNDDKENHTNCNQSADEEEPQLVLSHSHGGHGHSHCHKVPKTVSAIAWMVILGDGIHNFSDGLAIGAAFASSVTGGFSTSIAVFCHELPHEIGDFAVLLRAGMSIKQALVYNSVSSVLAFLGMVIGVFIGNIHGANLWIFAGVAGMFLYIALVDMLPQVSDVDTKKGENPFCHLLLQISGMLLGGGIMLIIAIFEHDMMEIL